MTIWTNPLPPYDGNLTVWAGSPLKRRMLSQRSLAHFELDTNMYISVRRGSIIYIII